MDWILRGSRNQGLGRHWYSGGTSRGHSQAVTYIQLSTKSSLGLFIQSAKNGFFSKRKEEKKNPLLTQPATHPRAHKHSSDQEVLSAIMGIPAVTLFPPGGLESKQVTRAESSGQCAACGGLWQTPLPSFRSLLPPCCPRVTKAD